LYCAPASRLRTHYRDNPYPGDRRQNETEMFSDHDETSPSITAVSAPSSLFHARSAATEKTLSPIRRRVRGTTRLSHDEARIVDIDLEYWQPMSEGLRYIPACVREATCEPAGTASVLYRASQLCMHTVIISTRDQFLKVNWSCCFMARFWMLFFYFKCRITLSYGEFRFILAG